MNRFVFAVAILCASAASAHAEDSGIHSCGYKKHVGYVICTEKYYERAEKKQIEWNREHGVKSIEQLVIEKSIDDKLREAEEGHIGPKGIPGITAFTLGELPTYPPDRFIK